MTKNLQQMRKKKPHGFQTRYTSSQQRGHHTAQPDDGQLFLKRLLCLMNSTKCQQRRVQRYNQEEIVPFIPTQPRRAQTQGMPEGLSHPMIPALSQSLLKQRACRAPRQRLSTALRPAAGKTFRNGTVGHHLFNSYSVAARD